MSAPRGGPEGLRYMPMYPERADTVREFAAEFSPSA